MNDQRLKAGERHIKTVGTTAMGARVAVVDGSRARLARLPIHRGWATTIHMALAMTVARHNGGQLVDASGCRVGHACAEDLS
jgi:hypothetical protein